MFAGEVGIVTGTMALPLARTPGDSADELAGSGVGLVVDARLSGGETWRRILTADGLNGWTAKRVAPLRLATVTLVGPSAAIKGASPDDGPLESAPDVSVTPGAIGTIEGASRSSAPSTQTQLLVPERLASGIQPWLTVRFDSTRGSAAIDWLQLHWGRDVSANTDVADALRERGLVGIVRRPFLSPARALLARLSPKADELSLALESGATTARPVRLAGEWTHVESIVNDAGTRELIAVFADSEARVFTFYGPQHKPLHVLVPEDQPFLLRAEARARPMGGGTRWLLEVVSTFGDGFYSGLWVVRGLADVRPRVDRIALSRGGGEGGTLAVYSGWWVDPDGRIWVSRSAESTALACFRDTPDALVPCTTAATSWLGIVSQTIDRLAARRRLVALDGRDPVGLFPVRSEGRLTWVVGRPLLSEVEVREWLAAHPGSKSITLPVRSGLDH